MEICLLDLPNELLEIIIFYIIGRPWKDDVCDFLSFTSTCRSLRRFIHDERYWQMMTLRRDPTCGEKINWFEYCKQIYSQRTIPGDELKESISRFNNDYFCTIEKVLLWYNKIRVYINERGDNSLGDIQHPDNSIIAFIANDIPISHRPIGIKNNYSKFSIEDERSEYLGYMDFPYNISLDSIGKTLIFQYGISNYTNTKLFRIDQIFIIKYNLKSLIRKSENNPRHKSLVQMESI